MINEVLRTDMDHIYIYIYYIKALSIGKKIRDMAAV
jgi:hypothetical protein